MYFNMHFVISLSFFVLSVVLVSSSDSDDDKDTLHLKRKRRDEDESDTWSKIQSLIQQARTETGDVDLNGLLSENVYDPVPLQAFNISSDGFITKLFGQFTELNLHGLKGFRVDRVAMNLAKMNLSADMSVPILSIIGQYYLDGTVTFFSLVGDGPFWMNMSAIKLRGHSLIGSTPEGRLSMGDINLESDVGDIALHFDNLMGGGAWGSISNSLLNQLSELILGELKPSLLRELSSYLKHQFDDVLFQQLPPGFMDPSSSNLVDSLLENSSEYMVEHGIEPLHLPEYEEIYESNLLFVTTKGEFKVYNGTLHGLSTIARQGDVVTVFENNSLVFEADFGFDNLTGSYSWIAELFGSTASGIMEIQVKSVDGFVKIKQDMKAGSKLELDTLYVKDIRHVWLDLQGLGRWDYVMESIVNLVTNGLKLQLADAIAEPVKKGIQEQLDLLNINVR